jgi:hypothetical protein
MTNEIEPASSLPPTAAAKPARQGARGRWQPVLLLVLIVAFLAVVVFTLTDNAAAVKLKIGDCFDIPSAASVPSVTQHPCTERHSAEVFTVVEYTGTETVVPTALVLETFVTKACDPVFASYVGKALEAAPELSIGYFFPSPDAWKGGDRTITCYLARTDQGPMSNSLRSSGGG